MTTLTADLFVTVDGYARGDNAPAAYGLFRPDLGRWIDAAGSTTIQGVLP